jgi:hypothetical protein
LSRRANKPAPLVSSHLRAESTRDEIPREPAHLATGGPTTDLLLAKGRIAEPVRVTKVSRVGVHPVTGDQAELREGFGRQPASRGAELVHGSTQERLRGPATVTPSGGTVVKGRKARGAAERGHG